MQPAYSTAYVDGHVQELRLEMDKLRVEKERLAEAHVSMQQAARALENERQAFDLHQVCSHNTLFLRRLMYVLLTLRLGKCVVCTAS
jgi:hypothetical protein